MNQKSIKNGPKIDQKSSKIEVWLTLKHKQTIPHSTTYWYCFINPRLKVTSRSRARPWGAEWTAWLTVLLMRYLCHYVGDMSAQSFLIVHHLVMCQNFFDAEIPNAYCRRCSTFFFKCLSNIKICFINIEASTNHRNKYKRLDSILCGSCVITWATCLHNHS